MVLDPDDKLLFGACASQLRLVVESKLLLKILKNIRFVPPARTNLPHRDTKPQYRNIDIYDFQIFLPFTIAGFPGRLFPH